MIKQANFKISVADASKMPDYGVPEIAIAGRSNVGKSSFINYLTGQGKLAKTSSAPGRTRLLNYFEINRGEFYLVDLPGYGYAQVSKSEKHRWGEMIDGYLVGSKNLINVFVLLDIRREPSEDDIMLFEFLYSYSIPFTVIATKADKLSRAQQQVAKSVIASKIGVGKDDIIVTSSEARIGAEAVVKRIEQLLDAAKRPYIDDEE